MNFSLEQLRSVCSHRRNRIFFRRSAALGKSQSSISAAIANLEVDLGNKLFSRDSRKPKLTAESIRLLDESLSYLGAMRTHVWRSK